MVASPCSLSDLQASSPTPQFKSIQFSAVTFLIAQLSHPYKTTGKISSLDYYIALTRRTFVGKVMSLLFNILSSLVTDFPPGSKRLLISCLQSPPRVILEPKTIKSVTVSIVSPPTSLEVMGLVAIILFI